MEQDSLHPYQLEGAKWLTEHPFRLLADEMGLGKSAQIVRATELLSLPRVLVICPSVARINWGREFEKFSVLGPRKFKILAHLNDTPHPLFSNVCSYEYAVENKDALIAAGGKEGWPALILDEFHYLKNVDRKRANEILGTKGLVHKVKRGWFISGTPAPNHAGELWILFRILGQTALSYDEFIDRYCTTYNGPRGLVPTGTKGGWYTEEIKQMLKPIMLRRRKEDVMLELPPLTFEDVVIEPGPVDIETGVSFAQFLMPVDRRDELAQIIEQQRRRVETELNALGDMSANAIKMLEAMAKSVSTLRMYTGLQKVHPFADMIASELEANAYHKIVIFAIHRDVIEGLRVRLQKFKPVTLYGGTDPETRQKNIDKFQNKTNKCRVFIGNIQAAGVAITLTAAHQVAFIEQDWVPANNEQALKRCHRIGQDLPVTVRFFGLANSIDARVAAVLKRKTKEITKFMDDELPFSNTCSKKETLEDILK